MLHIIAHLHIQPGREAAFHAYEQQALRIFQEHGGTLLGAFRPEKSGTVPDSRESEIPDEIHVLAIPSDEAFAAYRRDPRITALSLERVRVVRKTEVFVSRESIPY